MFLKCIRLIVYTLKGNYEYAFGQFEYTTYLRRNALHKRHAQMQKKSANAVVFDLKRAKDRYVFNIINTYKLADYDVFLKPNYEFYINSKGLYYDDIFSFLNVGYYKNEAQLKTYKKVHLVYDYDTICGLTLKSYTTVKVTNKGAIRAQALKFPFGFHPNTFKQFNITSAKRLDDVLFTDHNNTQNAYKIVFAGSTNSTDYNKINNHFTELIDRNKVFATIHKYFEKDITSDYKVNSEKTILISNSLTGSHINEIELFQIMKNSNFFIAPPGFEMPFCHNLFEAMSCGAIPILQYANYLFPNLENGVNCLIFDDLAGLRQCIEKALIMDREAINLMKVNVLEYYKKHVLPSAFVNKIENSNDKETPVFYVSGISN